MDYYKCVVGTAKLQQQQGPIFKSSYVVSRGKGKLAYITPTKEIPFKECFIRLVRCKVPRNKGINKGDKRGANAKGDDGDWGEDHKFSMQLRRKQSSILQFFSKDNNKKEEEGMGNEAIEKGSTSRSSARLKRKYEALFETPVKKPTRKLARRKMNWSPSPVKNETEKTNAKISALPSSSSGSKRKGATTGVVHKVIARPNGILSAISPSTATYRQLLRTLETSRKRARSTTLSPTTLGFTNHTKSKILKFDTSGIESIKHSDNDIKSLNEKLVMNSPDDSSDDSVTANIRRSLRHTKLLRQQYSQVFDFVFEKLNDISLTKLRSRFHTANNGIDKFDHPNMEKGKQTLKNNDISCSLKLGCGESQPYEDQLPEDLLEDIFSLKENFKEIEVESESGTNSPGDFISLIPNNDSISSIVSFDGFDDIDFGEEITEYYDCNPTYFVCMDTA